MKVAQRAAPQMAEVVSLTSPDATSQHGVYTRPACKLDKYAETGWGRGWVTLLGDAAHPMRPMGKLLCQWHFHKMVLTRLTGLLWPLLACTMSTTHELQVSRLSFGHQACQADLEDLVVEGKGQGT